MSEQKLETKTEAPKGIKVVKQPGQVAEGTGAGTEESQGSGLSSDGNTNCYC